MMAKRTKAAIAERQTAIDQLREWIKPGDTVYTVLDHVSSSGMSRAIRVVIPYHKHAGLNPAGGSIIPAGNDLIDFIHPNWAIGKALDLRHYKRNGREQDALVVGGCGMDMGFHLVHELSYTLYGNGYQCLGKGRCPSNYHRNHHDRVRCPGVFEASREEGDQYQHCYPLDSIRLQIDIGEGKTVDGGRMYGRDDGATAAVCATCQGEGYIANPDGPERFDLVHTDGYALRHRWI